MKVFTNDEFIKKLKWLVNDVANYYYSKSGTWCNYNESNNKFMMDCVVSIKGLLWGFKADKHLPHGGGKYCSNGVADFGANDGIKYCDDVSQDFTNLKAGEYLCMKGTSYNHAGIYLGNGKVFECTTTWKARKCIISEIDTEGYRYYNGVKAKAKWTYHGKLIYIDYKNSENQNNNSNNNSNWKIGKYKLLKSKYIRKTPKIGNNIVNAKNCTPATKKVLVKQTGFAQIKAGAIVTIMQITKENNRIWGKCGNCYINLCTKDGVPQAIKVD